MTEREWEARRPKSPWTFADWTDAAVAIACILGALYLWLRP